MKWAYVEIDTHAELVFGMQRLVPKDFPIRYFITEKIQKLAQLPLSATEPVRSDNVLDSIRAYRPDFIIIGTAHRYFHVFDALVKEFPCGIIIHNRNFVEAKLSRITLSILKKESLYRLKLLFKEALLKKNLVYRNALVHLFLEPKSHFSKKELYFPVFTAEEEKSSPAQQSSSYFVVPGTVEDSRRNYSQILRFLETKGQNWKAVFLGKLASENIRQEILSSAAKDRIIYFEEKVSESEFRGYMDKAAFLWCPVVEQAEFFSIPEFYGSTKASGNTGDSLRYGKWAVFPDFYAKWHPLMLHESEFFQNPEIISRSLPTLDHFQREILWQSFYEKITLVLKKLT